MASSRRQTHSSSPYTDGEFDRAFFRVLGSDWRYVATRIAMLVVVYWLLARAIIQHNLGPSFLLLPLAFEVLVMCWLGFVLSRTVVDCPAFRQTSGHTMWVIALTVVIFIVASGVVIVEDQSIDFGRFVPGWRVIGQRVIETGLIWAMLAEAAGLLLATFPEVRRWRQVGGKFVWTSIIDLSLRLAALLLIVLGGILVSGLFGLVGPWLERQPNGASWLVFGFLLLVEVGGLVMAIKIHGDLVKKESQWLTAAEAAQQRRG